VTPESISRVREGDERLLRRRLAGDLDNIVLKAMQKEPGRRYASVDQLSSDLGRHLQGLPVVARKDTLGYRTRKFVGRHKAGVALAAAVLLLIVGFSVSVTVLWQRAVHERQRAVREGQRTQAVSGFLEQLLSSSNPRQSHGETVTARELLDRGVQEIDRGLRDQPEVRADLMETMGRAYHSLGLYEQARPLLEEALRLSRQTRGRDDLFIAQDLWNLAGDLFDLGKKADAEPLIREAVSIQRARGETENIDYAKGLNNLGEFLEDRGDFAQAEADFKESLAIKNRLPTVDEKDIATSLNNLGKLYDTQGEYAAAEPYYQRALAMRRKLAGGRPDPDLATSLGNVASIQQEKGDLAGAEANYRDALAMRRKLYQDPSPKIAGSLNNLGYVLTLERKFSDAEACYREALSIAALPKFDPWMRATFLRNLADAQLSEGKAAEAEVEAREALAVFRAKRPTHWRTADAESVLGGCLAAQGRFEEAERLLLESYPRLKEDKGDGAKHAAEAKQRINDLYKAWGKPEKMMS
jgi:tetratricopeptide (TPR) repeat protein